MSSSAAKRASKTPKAHGPVLPGVREAFLHEIHSAFEAFEAIIADISDETLCQPGAIGDWSVKDVLVHLTAWEKRLLQRVGGKPEDGAGIGTPQFNATVYQANRDRTLDDAQAEFVRVHRRVVRLVASLSDESIEKWKHALRLNTFNHYKWASRNVKRWQRSIGA
jgi:uncharacterized protein (TIGR03083 family)